jgi:hypothetical protein
MPQTMAPLAAPASVAASGARTARIASAPLTAAARVGAISAPASSKSASESPAWVPAPASTATVAPRPVNFFTVSGVAASARIVQDGNPHLCDEDRKAEKYDDDAAD